MTSRRLKPYRRLIWPAALWLLATLLPASSVLTEPQGSWFGHAGAHETMQELLATLAWLSAAWFCARLFRVVVSGGERPVPRLLSDMVGILLFVLAIILVLGSVFHQPVEALVTTSSVVVAVLGFALRELIGDIFAGICINMERPYALGDWIEMPPHQGVGKVVEINWRATRLVTLNGTTVVMPNGMMARNRFINYSTPRRSFRIQIPVVLGFDVAIPRASKLLCAAMRKSPQVLPHPQPDVIVDGFAETGVRYMLRLWVADYEPMHMVRNTVLSNVHNHLRLGGIVQHHARHDLTLARAAGSPFDQIGPAEELDGRRVGVLRQVTLFRALTTGDLEELAQALDVRQVGAETVVVEAGASGRSLFVIVEGLLEVRDASGVLATLGAGDVFGEMSLLTGAPRSATVAAATDAVLFEISDHHIRPILQRRPSLADELGSIIGQRQNANRKRVEDDVETGQDAHGSHLLDRIRDFFGLVR